MDNQIVLDGLVFSPEAAKPFTFTGDTTGQVLAGFELDFWAIGHEAIKPIEDLLAKESIDVTDPFVGRAYKARIRQRTMSHQDDSGNRGYRCEIKELDQIPALKQLEINGDIFEVIAYDIVVFSNGSRIHTALLLLSPDDFATVGKIPSTSQPHVKRIGIDSEALVVHMAGNRFWSKHEIGATTEYKAFFRWANEPVAPTRITRSIASGVYQDNIIELLFELKVNFDKLILALRDSGSLKNESLSQFADDTWNGLEPHEQLSALYQRLSKVDDARNFMKD